MRRYRGTAGALGKAFYKGGFESRMNRREAALILQLRYDEIEDAIRSSILEISC
jgi:DnaJ family protein C protein 19